MVLAVLEYLKLNIEAMLISRLTNRDYSEWHLNDLGVAKVSEDDKALLSNQNIAAHYCEDVRFMKDHVIIADGAILGRFENIVFEGAQGLMLDQNNLDYFPHLTPSNTGVQNIVNCLDGLSMFEFEVCYVTRTYLTRHGAGHFSTECPRELMYGVMEDKTNHCNEFQGGFRYGFFDFDMFKEHVSRDISRLGNLQADLSIAVTHADETNSMILNKYGQKMPVNDLRIPNAEVKYISYGEKRTNIGNIK